MLRLHLAAEQVYGMMIFLSYMKMNFFYIESNILCVVEYPT